MTNTDDDFKKRGKVKLVQEWWKDAWPMSTKPKADAAMRTALADYKKAKRGKSVQDLKEALQALDGVLNKLLGEAGKIPKSSLIKKNAIIKDLKDAKTQVAKELCILEKVGNKMRVIFKRDFGNAISERLAKHKLSYSSKPVSLEILEAVAIELDARSGLAMLNNLCNTHFDRAVDLVDRGAKKAITDNGGWVTRRADGEIRRCISKEVSNLENALRDAPLDVIKKLKLHADVAAKYNRDRAVKLGKAGAGLALSSAGAALPGTLPFALVGVCRSIIALSKELAKTLADLDLKIAVFKRCLTTLEKFYKKGRSKAEIGTAIFDKLIGADVMPNLKNAKGQLKEIEKCVAIFYHRATKLNSKVKEALDKSKRLCERFEKSAADVKAFMKGKKGMSIRIAMKRLDLVLNSCHDIMRQAVSGDKQLPVLRHGLAELGANPKGVDKANIIIGTMITGALAIAGICDAAAVGQTVESIIVADMSAWMDAVEMGEELAEL